MKRSTPAKATARRTSGSAAKRAAKKAAPAKKRGPHKMKAYASFDLYLADQPPRNQTIIRALRKFVKRTEPDLVEFVKWGNGCWIKGKVPISYVYSDVDHVQFGFVRGSALKDPQHLLEGNGAYVRHIKVRSAKDIDEPAFAALLHQAAR